MAWCMRKTIIENKTFDPVGRAQSARTGVACHAHCRYVLTSRLDNFLVIDRKLAGDEGKIIRRADS